MNRSILLVLTICIITACGSNSETGASNPMLMPGPDGSPGVSAGFNFQTTMPLRVQVLGGANQTYTILNEKNKNLSDFTTDQNGERSLLLTVPATTKGLYLVSDDKTKIYQEVHDYLVVFELETKKLQMQSLVVDYGSQYFPSLKGYATLVFEDLWPYLGDYDFNDLVVDYNIREDLNRSGLITGVQIQLKVVGTLASMRNGFGFQLGVSSSLVASVDGAKYTRGYTELEANGTESRQSKAVIIAFEDAKAHHNPDDVSLSELITIDIKFVNGVHRDELGYPPYNPFLLSNGERGREIHLPGYQPTDLVNIPYFLSEDDTSNLIDGRSYIDTGGLPWAVNLPETFFYPLDSKGIDETYNNFLDWVESEGLASLDWYKDKPEYRETKFIHRKRGTLGYVTCEDPFGAHNLLARYDSSVSTSILDGLGRSAIHPNFNGNVNVWKDLSGNGFDVKSESDKSAPKVSTDSGTSDLQKDSHVLGATDDFLLVDIPDITSDFTFIMVSTPSHEDPDDFDSFFSNSMSPSEDGSWQLVVRASDSVCANSSQQPVFAVWLRDGSSNVAICGGEYNDSRNVLSVNYDSSTKEMTLSRNGYVEGVYKWSSIPTFRFLKMFMNRASSRFFDGKIHELVMISSPLTKEENANVGHYLSCKWQVEL